MLHVPCNSIYYLEPAANFNFTYCAADWINHRDESLITISDSSDEDLPLLLEMPEKQQTEEDDDDDDIVILAEVMFIAVAAVLYSWPALPSLVPIPDAFL